MKKYFKITLLTVLFALSADGADTDVLNEGLDCWAPCGHQQGACEWCGSDGICCTQKNGWTDVSNGCDGTIGGLTRHECVLNPNRNPFGCDKIALKTAHGNYVVAGQDGTANANSKSAGTWETFTVEDFGGNKIALKSFHGKYLVAEANFDVNANRAEASGWETFKVEKHSDGKFSLKTAHGRYVVAESDGRLKADRTTVGGWEKFRVECKGGDESETTNTESPSTTGSSLSTDEILSLYNLQNTQLFRDNDAEITLETIEWTQIERCWYYLGECQEDFYLVDYYQDGNKNNNVYKVFVAKEVAIPDSFNTAGYNDQLNLAFFDYEAEGVATMVFVIMPSDWDIFQHRFKTRAINTLAAMAGDALRKQGTKYLITTAVKVGAAMGSVVPGLGTVAGAAIAGTAVKVGLTLYQWQDDIFGEYLRHIG